MSEVLHSAGKPGAPRCSEAATGPIDPVAAANALSGALFDAASVMRCVQSRLEAADCETTDEQRALRVAYGIVYEAATGLMDCAVSTRHESTAAWLRSVMGETGEAS